MNTGLPEPLEHVLRPQPPWRRTQQITECGLPLEGHPVITRDEFLAKVKSQGQQRSAMTTCMTCWQTARRHPSWDENPVLSIIREARRFEYPAMAEKHGFEGGAKLASFRDELLAIAVLIEAHREEFDELVSGIGDTVQLDAARRAKRRRAR